MNNTYLKKKEAANKKKENGGNSRPGDITNEHPVTIFVLVAWNILRTVY